MAANQELQKIWARDAKKIVEQGETMAYNERNIADDADIIKDNKEVHAKKETMKRKVDIIAKKVKYDLSVHTLNPNEEISSKTRYKKGQTNR